MLYVFSPYYAKNYAGITDTGLPRLTVAENLPN